MPRPASHATSGVAESVGKAAIKVKSLRTIYPHFVNKTEDKLKGRELK